MTTLPDYISTGPATSITGADPDQINWAASKGYLHLHRPERGHARMFRPEEAVGLFVFDDCIRSGLKVEAAASIASGLIEMQARFPNSDRLYLNRTVDGTEWTAEPIKKGKALHATCYDVRAMRALLARRYASL